MQTDSPIQTKRLYLRSLRMEDVGERYLAWMQDPVVLRFLEARLQTHTLETLRHFVLAANANPQDLLLGMFIRTSHQHIGNIKIGPVNAYHRNAAVGLLVGEREHWGVGFATEAILGATEYSFHQLNVEKLYAGCYAANEGSRRAFLRAGYREEGRFKGYWFCDGQREDGIQLGCLKSDWLSGSSSPV